MLVPIYDIMTQMFEDKVEEFIEQNQLSMKELQAYYKVRTKILHYRITELNLLVDQQNDDIKHTRSQYTDELFSLREEVGDLKNMAH